MKENQPNKVKKPKSTPESRARVAMARFIVEKYVEKKKILWGRDMKFGFVLADEFPSLKFWESLDVKFISASILCLMTPNAKKFLKARWQVFNLDIPVKAEYQLENHKTGEDFVSQKTEEISSIKDFCK